MSHVNGACSLRVLRNGAQSVALLPLFEVVFGHRVSEAQWSWKYADHRSFHVVCDVQDVGVVGHAAVQFAGSHPQGGLLGQVGDVMVHPLHRGQWVNGVFALMLDALAQEAVARGYGLCYGFPGERPARLGLRLGVYQEVGRPVEAVFLPTDQRVPGWHRLFSPLKTVTSDQCRQFLAKSGGTPWRMGRDTAHVVWRYLDAHHDYRFVRVGRLSANSAMAVLKPLDDGTWLLLDWLGSLPASVPLLRRLSRHCGAELRHWAHSVVRDGTTTTRPSPFVTIRLAKVPLQAPWHEWFDASLPGDVDVY